MAAHENADGAEQNDEQHDGEKDEAVARNALLVAHRTKTMHATGGQIGDEPRIVGGRPAEMVPDAVEERGQIVFADAQFVKLIGRGGLLGVGQRFYLFENRLLHRRRRRRGGFVRASDGRTVRNGGGAEFRSGCALKLRIELLDFGFEGGDLVGEGARTVGKRVIFFLRGPHTTISAPHQNGNQHAQRGQGNQHQRPGHRQTKSAQLAKTGVGERHPLRFGRWRRVVAATRFAVQDGKFEPRGVPFHARVFDGGEAAGEFDAEIVLRPRFVVDGLDFIERVAEIGDGRLLLR